MSINKVTLLGNIGSIETKTFDWGKVTNASLATGDKAYIKDGKEVPAKTEWHNLIFTGKLAEIAEQYVSKGDKLYIEGKLRYRSYDSNGVTKYVTEIYVTQMEMLTPKGEQTTQAPPQQTQEQKQPPQPTQSDMFDGKDDDQLPF